MKNILFLVFLCIVFLFISGCDNDLNSDNDLNNIPLANIRSVADDPILDCVVEQVHQHNGIHYSGHYNNDGHGHHGLQADNICTIDYCTETNLHEHNGIHYTGHNNSCGNGHSNGHGHGNGHH
jgi:hypothetical protein